MNQYNGMLSDYVYIVYVYERQINVMYHVITAYRKKKEKKIDNIIVKPRQYIKMTLNV